MGSSGKLLCDHCEEAPAILYCRADTARLCLACDRQVHSANPIFSKHSRAHLCDSCRANAASIFCSSHRTLLCPNCDFDAHPPADAGAPHHHRRPVEPFSGCPSALELASSFGFDDDDKSLWFGPDDDAGEGWGHADGLVWETPSVVCMSDLILPEEELVGSGLDFQALDALPPPKHRKAACGKHKEEVILQLRRLFESEAIVYNEYAEADLVPGLQSAVLQPNRTVKNSKSITNGLDDSTSAPGYEMNGIQWHEVCYGDMDKVPFQYENFMGSSVQDSSMASDVNEIHMGEISQAAVGEVPQHVIVRQFPAKGVRELTGPNRDSVISRYKEKRKTRRYDKQIRYESRKARADNRVRIRGRFAKGNPDIDKMRLEKS